jgi:SAM-dependent methyltransferase
VDAPPCAARGHVAELTPALRGVDRWYGVPGDFVVVRCATCGMAGTSPRLAGEALDAYYPSTYYAHGAAEGGAGPAVERGPRAADYVDGLRLRLAFLAGAFRPLFRRPGRLLDVGCGTGELAAYFAGRGWRASGIEPSAGAVAAATARGIEMHHGTIDDAPWPAASFDAVTFNHALEHVPDPLDALRRARDLVRPGGLVLVSVPNFGGWQRRAFGGRWFQLDLPRHLQHLDRRSIAILARDAGLDVVAVRTSSALVGLAGSLVYAVRGHMALRPGRLKALGWATFPLVLLADLLLREGDCLHLVARR